MVNRQAIQRYEKKMLQHGFMPDDPELYESGRQNEAQVPPQIEQILVDVVKWADTQEVKSQLSEDEMSYLLMCLLEDNNIKLKQHWIDHSGPSQSWWAAFYKRHPELSAGVANRLQEVHVTAHTPAAICAWHKLVTEPNEADGWYGFTPAGMEEYLRKNMPHIIAGWTDDEISRRAYALCHDPRLQGNFDQKGHAMGGVAMKVVATKYSRRHCRDISDNTWVSVCPLVNAAGETLFVSLVIKGSFAIHPTLKDTLWGPSTVLADSPTGYSSASINIEQWKKGIAQLKQTRPELFPMVCWLDSWEGHTDMDFRKMCRAEGVILMAFRSHGTVWSCQLDNGPFGKYETTYNAEIHKLKTPAHDDGEGTGMQIKRTEKLPLHIAAKAIRKACDAAFNAPLLQKGATDTIWRKKLAGESAPELIQLAPGKPLMPAIELNVDSVLQKACEQQDQAQAAAKEGESKAAQRSRRRATYVKDKLEAGERVWQKIILPRVPLARGTNVERDDDGNYVCQHCRQHAQYMKDKAGLRKWSGGCMSLEEDEKKHAVKQAADEEEQEAKDARKEEWQAKRAKRDDEERERRMRRSATSLQRSTVPSSGLSVIRTIGT